MGARLGGQVAQVGPGVDVARLLAEPGDSGEVEVGEEGTHRHTVRRPEISSYPGQSGDRQDAAELTAAVVVGQEGPVATIGCLAQPAERTGRDLRHVHGQDPDEGGRSEQGVDAREQTRDRSAEGRVLAGEGHRPRGDGRGADDDNLTRVKEGAEAPVEQRPPVELEAALVGPVHPGGCAAGEEDAAEGGRRGVKVHLPSLPALAPGWQAGGVSDQRGDRLRVRLVQWASDLDPATNRDRLAALSPTGATEATEATEATADQTDLVVFPEAFARDFGPADDALGPYAEALAGPFGQAVEALAAQLGATVIAGMFEASQDADRPFNTLLLHGAAQAAYRKIHLYDSFGFRESDRLSGGPIAPVVTDVAGFRVGLMTCYDLRFPELARALVDAGAEVLVVPSAWVAGERKVDHWRTLVRARAIENTVFVVAVGQPGPHYCGHSLVVDPLGDVLVEAGPEEAVLDATLERDVLEAARRTNPSLANRRL